MTSPTAIKEITSKTGILFDQTQLAPVLCKPKIMPLKSFTQDKLEKMQREAQKKMKQMHDEAVLTKVAVVECAISLLQLSDKTSAINDAAAAPTGPSVTDVWRAEDD